MGRVSVIIDNLEYYYEKNTTLFEISKDFKNKYDNQIILAYVDNEISELNRKIKGDCKVEFITLNSREGNRLYQKGLIFLLNAAFVELFGYKYYLRCCYSIDKAIKFETNLKLSEFLVKKLKERMELLVKDEKNIEKIVVKKKEAIDYFNRTNNYIKAKTYKYNTKHYASLYKLDNVYNYIFSPLPYNTSLLKKFDLQYLDEKSFILKFPNIKLDSIPLYEKRPKIEKAYNEFRSFSNTINIDTVPDINDIVSNGKIDNIIKMAELDSNKRLYEIARDIKEKKENIKLILLSGPSSSGKTTIAKKLSLYLKSLGINLVPISIDDYFVDKLDTPKLENGEYDFESIKALDIQLFNKHLNSLLNGEEVEVPIYNFLTGTRENIGKKVKLEKDEIIIVEGLHAINDELTKEISRENKYKIYASPLMDLNIDNLSYISTTDLRLMRRIIRDSRTRGYDAIDTIRSCNRVRDGEENYIFPLQEDVDVIFNTSYIYEIGVLKLYVLPLLYKVESNTKEYETARHLIRILDMFLEIPSDSIPSDSIIREFIGNSFFK